LVDGRWSTPQRGELTRMLSEKGVVKGIHVGFELPAAKNNARSGGNGRQLGGRSNDQTHFTL